MARNYRSELVGVFGCPIDENPTGVIEEAAFAAKGLDYRYITMKVEKESLAEAMAALRALHFRGINLTIPHKVAAVQYVDALSPEAEIIGAINVVVNDQGRLWGDNTDGKGFLKSLTDNHVELKDKTLTILGAGGAARAIAVECAVHGIRKIFIVNRSQERGKTLAELINAKTSARAEWLPWNGPIDIPSGTDILVNATCVGLYPDTDQKPEINYASVLPGMTVCDVIFNDPNTLFLKEAAMRGCKTIRGLEMLVNQGALNYRLWTRVDAPVDVMTRALMNEFHLA